MQVEISIQTERIANLQENEDSDASDVSFNSIDEYEINSSDDTEEDTEGDIENSF